MELARLADSLTEPAANDGARLPKYLRLSDGIARAIEDGALKAGDKLPPEAEMAAHLPASLGTVQKALNHLADRGLVVRRHGHGTFVGERAMAPQDLWHFRFLDDDGQGLLPVYTRVTDIRRTAEPGPWADFLGSADLVRVDRLMDVNHEFTGLTHLYLPADRFAGLLTLAPESLEGVNIRAFLGEEFAAATHRVEEQVACAALPGDVTRALGLPAGQVGLIYHMRGADYREAPLSYQVAYFPPSARRLAMGEKQG